MAHSAGTSASAQDPGKGLSAPNKNASFTNPKQFVDMIEMLVSGLRLTYLTSSDIGLPSILVCT